MKSAKRRRFADRRITVNSDFYYIKWVHIQQVLDLTCGYPYDTNAGNAYSYGPELEVSALVAPGLTLDLSGAYNTAVINDPNGCRHRLRNNARNTRSQRAEVHGQRGSELPRTDHRPIERLF